MLQPKRFGLLAAYLVSWLLGMTFLNALPEPVRAGYARPIVDGALAGNPVKGSAPVSLSSRQIGLQTISRQVKLNTGFERVRLSSFNSSTDDASLNGKAGSGRTIAPYSLPGVPALDFTFPGNTVTQADLENLPGQRIPPDTMGAAGLTQYMMVVNGLIRVFTKSTGLPESPFGAADPDLETFFSAVMTPAVDGITNSVTSPEVRYDRFSSRWFILAIDVPLKAGKYQANRIMLAVSDGPIITSGTTWKLFWFQTATVITGLQDTYSTRPSLGIDANALYIGVNLYTTGSQAFYNSAAFVVRKSSVINPGDTPVITGFAPLIVSANSITTPEGPIAPRGVDNLDSSVSEGYFIGLNYNGTATSSKLQLRKITNPGGVPSISANIPVMIPLVQQPLLVPHKGGGNLPNNLLNPVDYSLTNAVIQKGSLWTVQSIGVNDTGAGAGVIDRDGARWYEITLPAGVSSATLLRQSGTIYDNSVSQRSYWLPSLTVSGQGHTLVGFNVAGTNDYISAAFAGRTSSDSLNTTRSPVLYQTSTVPYTPANNPGNVPGGRPWGSYSFTSLDPEDNMTFWTIQPYAYNSDVDNDHVMDGYGIQIARVKAPPPANLVSANPPFVIADQSNVDITITGSSLDGSGFYDPGPAFTKHLTASVGGGVTVNSVTYLNPTTIKINVSAVGVPPGQYDVTVTNPDGQAMTTPNLLKVTCYQAVTDNAGDGEPGSLRDAINNIKNSGGCATVNLKNVTHPITLTGPLTLPPGIILSTAKPCSAGQVEIKGNGFDDFGMSLNGGYFFGIYIHGFKKQPFIINGGTGPNNLTCVKVEAF